MVAMNGSAYNSSIISCAFWQVQRLKKVCICLQFLFYFHVILLFSCSSKVDFRSAKVDSTRYNFRIPSVFKVTQNTFIVSSMRNLFKTGRVPIATINGVTPHTRVWMTYIKGLYQFYYTSESGPVRFMISLSILECL